MCRRGIIASLTCVNGCPGDPEWSMLMALDEAWWFVSGRPTVSAHVFPFRRIPGSRLYTEAVDRGYRPPTGLPERGNQLECQFTDTRAGRLQPAVKCQLALRCRNASCFHRLVRPSASRLDERISGWRVGSGDDGCPAERKLDDALAQPRRRETHREGQDPSRVMSPGNERVASVD
jgi:hypothetical protein